MSNEQYLDAISCPRIDPVAQGEKLAHSLGRKDASSDTAEDSEAYETDKTSIDGDISPEDHDGDQQKGLGKAKAGRLANNPPEGTIEPDGQMERSIEQVCRIICAAPDSSSAELERRFREKFKDRPKYTFLDPESRFHTYYKWRLARNRAGDGIAPKYDVVVDDDVEDL